ncbi:hypothetical protein [Phyllobacterium sp. SB3]|uniref:hypothetical protein n=1 Tax=Phyllobacterium sp. SB3 TaxID=3156073 RepID=UPI0032AEDAEB
MIIPHHNVLPPVKRSLRKRLESVVETLVSLLDEIDGDSDFEDDDRELDQAEDGVADRDALHFIEQSLHPERFVCVEHE